MADVFQKLGIKDPTQADCTLQVLEEESGKATVELETSGNYCRDVLRKLKRRRKK